MVFGVVLLTGLIGILTLGLRLIRFEPIDIQIHDTYIVVGNFTYLLVIFTILLVGIYLIRAVATKFNNLPVNLILLVGFAIAITLLMVYLVQLNNWPDGVEAHHTFNGGAFDEQFERKVTSVATTTKSVAWTLVVLFAGGMAGLIYKIKRKQQI